MKYPYLKLFFFILATIYFFKCTYYPIGLGEWHAISFLDLIFHEAGHTLTPTFLLGDVITMIGGSAMQVLIPLVCAGHFLIRKEMLSMSVMLMWAAENIANVSVYMGDALNMNMQLLGGDNVVHDWNFILGHTNLLVHTDTLAKTTYVLAWITFTVAFSIGLNTFFKNQN